MKDKSIEKGMEYFKDIMTQKIDMTWTYIYNHAEKALQIAVISAREETIKEVLIMINNWSYSDKVYDLDKAIRNRFIKNKKVER